MQLEENLEAAPDYEDHLQNEYEPPSIILFLYISILVYIDNNIAKKKSGNCYIYE